jgi:hypothetical protein
MAQTIHTRALAQAVEIHSSTQALASELRVPENTLLRWMSGRAQMPVAAFRRVIEILVQHERQAGVAAVVSLPAEAEKVKFDLGEVAARCPSCDNTQFLSTLSRDSLRMTSLLACEACKQTVTYGELIVALAAQATRYSRLRPGPAPRPVATWPDESASKDH